MAHAVHGERITSRSGEMAKDEGYADSMPAENTGDDVPKGYFTSHLFLGTYIAVAISVISGTGSYSLISGVLAQINAELGPDPDYLWIGYTYTLCTACTFCLVGRVSDLFGRRYVIIGGNALALVGSIVASQAQTVKTVIGGMALISVGTSCQIGFQFILGELVPIGKRFAVMSTLFAWSILGGGLGAAWGLLFQHHTAARWRSSFYLLTGINFLATALLCAFYFPPTFRDLERTKTKRQMLREFDFVGVVLFTAGLVITCIVVGFATLIAFVAWEWNTKTPTPFMPLYLFRNYRWVCMALCLSIGASQYYAIVLVWPQMVSALWPVDVASTQYAFLITIPALCLLSGQVTGGLAASLVSPRLILMSGTLIGTAIMGGAASANEYDYGGTITMVVIGYFFIGFQEAVCGTFCTIALENQDDIGTGGGVAATMRSGISALASAILGAVLSNSLQNAVAQRVPEAAMSAGLPMSSVDELIALLTGAGTAEHVDGLTPQILDTATHAYRSAASIAFRNVILTAVGMGVITIVCSWFAPEVDTSKKQVVAKQLGRKRTEEPIPKEV
ncbi:hypothetical protein E8E14_000634 [Neopestalotiopsis sp. 37M]|nr:hypothetical protein E8E14_000634 [Neopestalotiopsis sp. 37M]